MEKEEKKIQDTEQVEVSDIEKSGNNQTGKSKSTQHKILIGVSATIIMLIVLFFLMKGFFNNKKQDEDVVQIIESPVITVYQEKIVTGINSELDLQDDVIISVESEKVLEFVNVEFKNKKTDEALIEDKKDGKEKNGVPAKTLQFLKEGDYDLLITAVDVEDNKSEMVVEIEVGPELISYIDGLHDWTIEVNSTDIDFMKEISWNDEYISEVQVDATNVDFTKEGAYELLYIIKGEIYGSEKVIEKGVKVTVISAEESVKKADEGTKVVTSGGAVKKDSSGKIPTGNTSTNNTGSNNSGSGTGTSKPSTDTGSTSSTSKPSTDTGSGSGTSKPSTDTGSGSGTSKPSTDTGSGSGTSKPSHTHTWVEQYRTVYHEAVYEDQWVVDKAAWTEEVAIYETIYMNVCNQCKIDITGNESAHNKKHAMAGEPGGWHSEWDTVQTGTNTINHPEEGHYEKVCIKEAWTEQIFDGYKCSCGATK